MLGDQIRLCLSVQMLGFLRAHNADSSTPIVLGGDFNSLWGKWQSDPFDQVCTNNDTIVILLVTLTSMVISHTSPWYGL